MGSVLLWWVAVLLLPVAVLLRTVTMLLRAVAYGCVRLLPVAMRLLSGDAFCGHVHKKHEISRAFTCFWYKRLVNIRLYSCFL
jgi:hypothetical protein